GIQSASCCSTESSAHSVVPLKRNTTRPLRLVPVSTTIEESMNGSSRSCALSMTNRSPSAGVHGARPHGDDVRCRCRSWLEPTPHGAGAHGAGSEAAVHPAVLCQHVHLDMGV